MENIRSLIEKPIVI